jgi:hypothetical protein
VLQHGGINLTFRRNFGTKEILEWEQLEELLRGVHLNDEQDTILWALTPSCQFNTASLYEHCSS